jgi:hypothetical protein
MFFVKVRVCWDRVLLAVPQLYLTILRLSESKLETSKGMQIGATYFIILDSGFMRMFAF